MLELITDWLIKRRLRKEHIDANSPYLTESGRPFVRMLNTFRENKVMVFTLPDGIYIRLAGDETKGQILSKELVRVVKFEETENKE